MENVHIIAQIVEIEKNAQKKITDAKESQARLPEEIEATLNADKRKYAEKAAKEVEIARERETKGAAERIAKLEAEYKARTAKLDRVREEQMNKWISILYGEIIDV